MSKKSPVVKFLDFIDEIGKGGKAAKENSRVLGVYVFFIVVASIVYNHFSDRDYSAVITLAAGVQVLGYYLLLEKIRSTKSAAGISVKTLQIARLVLMFRLMSTTVANGYLPKDKTGDYVYQWLDFAALMVIWKLIRTIKGPFASTYQHDLDTMPIYRCIPLAIALGWFFHGDLNLKSRAPFAIFDIFWAISLNLDTIAMLPQLWLLVAKGGQVEALTSHYVASIAVSRLLFFAFWWHAYDSLAPASGGCNVFGYYILAAIGMQILLSSDFLYHYITWGASGKNKGGLILANLQTGNL